MAVPPLSRRRALVGAAALAGAGAALSAPVGAADTPSTPGGRTDQAGAAGPADPAGPVATATDGEARHKPAKAVVFRNVRPLGAGAPVDLTVVDGRFTDRPAPAGAQVVDGGGRIALPGLVDAHIHPDKTTWGGDWISRRPASGIAEYGEQDAELFRSQPRSVGERAYGLLAHAVTRGTRAVRAHVDVAPAYGLKGLEGVAEARERLAHALDVQIVGFPQHGVVRTPGTSKLLEDAARSGLLDQVGGIDPISFDHALVEQLDLVFGLADRYGVGVDIHLHDRDEKGVRVLRAIIERTKALSLRGKVTVSHVFCLPFLGRGELETIAADLAGQDIALTTVAPSAALLLPLATLHEHGVRVGLGSDGVRDSWSPFGNADMLHRTHILGWITGARLDEELVRCHTVGTHGGADVLGLDRVEFRPGDPADFVLLRGECVPQVVVDMPQRDVVVHGGRVVARDGALL
ncbi:amidohydrolase [Streptomyces sp. 796.1]|uniref:amidohydrolase n=1 Tax=Streptomyces sp. 796.1 TaxID=3163029 RepID=UPI0039C8E1E6